MREPSPQLRAQLEALASTLDEQAPTIPVTEPTTVTARARSIAPQRIALVAAAVVALIITGVVALSVGDRGDGERTQIVGPTPSDSSTTSTTPAEPALDWANLPRAGIAVQPVDGPVQIYDLEGTLLGTTPAPGSGDDLRPQGALLLGMGLGFDDHSAVEVPDGCTSAQAGGARRVALCGAGDSGPTRIELVDSAGERTVLVEGSLEPNSDLGFWRWAIPSPDGAWVLAQWSGECEAPRAWLISVATGSARPVGGTDPGSPSGPLTEGLGWTPDGRAIVQLRSGGCGPEIPDPGTYLVSTADLAKDQLLPQQGDPPALVYAWRSRPNGNPLEALVDRISESIPFEQCCQEPSHGDLSLTTGWTYEGYDISVLALPTDQGPGPYRDFTVEQRMPLGGGEAAIFSAGAGSPATSGIAFRCGANTWWISWTEPSSPEVDSMLLLAEDLLPHLGCTLGEPPPSSA